MFMKAAITEKYGAPEVLQIKDVPEPSINDDELLVRVKAAAVTVADSRIRGARFPKGFGLLARLIFGLTKPRSKILGNTYSGIVEEVGRNVTEFNPGDEVCGTIGIKMGTHAGFVKIDKAGLRTMAKKSDKISHEEAAGLLFGGTTALYFVRDKAKVAKGEKVVINGASGAVGTNAVQLAKYYGAEVTGVTSADNARLVQDLGATHIINYKEQSLVDSGQKFDVVVDAVGNIPPEAGKILLNKNGRMVLVVANLWETLRARGQVKTGVAQEKKEDIEFLLSLVEKGELKVIIEKVYDFKDVAEAHRRVDSGHKVGNVLIRL